MTSLRRAAFLSLATLAFGASLAEAQTPLTTTRVANGLVDPVFVTSPPGDPRLFIVEQRGRIQILENGSIQTPAFLNIGPSVTYPGTAGESGLLGMAFHPDYAENGLFYVNYTNNAGTTRISEFSVSATDPNLADPNSEVSLFGYSQPFSNHNGGMMAFNPLDGLLYISSGDGGGANDPGCRAQDIDSRLGKILRVDVGAGGGWSNPPDNPYVGVVGAKQQIYHLGLRNPWRFSFDRLTGDMFIGDVGQGAREEISFAPFGVSNLNFGWKVMEGNICGGMGACPGGTALCNDSSYTDPFQVYNTNSGGTCAITGGYVYRGCAIPDLQGTYFYADYCSDQIWSLRYDGSSVTDFQERTSELDPPGGQSILSPSSFGEDAFGELYICDRNGGEVFKIIADAPVAGTDCDSNGQVDSCEISLAAHKDLDTDGGLDVCQEFSADTGEISLADGGEQNMAVHFGAGEGGNLFWINGSATGTAPPLMVAPGLDLPLVFDSYTFLTATKPNKAPLNPSLGFMDANGDGDGRFTVPAASDPTLAGVTLFHAAGSLNLAFEFLATSNPISLTLVP